MNRPISTERCAQKTVMNSELAAELSDEAQLKSAVRELRQLRRESSPLERAWSDTRIARQGYEQNYAFAIKQLREREGRIMDQLWPYLVQIEALEKQVRKLDRKMRKAQSSSRAKAE
jgi:chromosome segregation ATPase